MFTKDKKIIFVSILVGLIVSLSISSKNYSEKVQSGIAQNIIRFHVLANSNLEIDQRLKLNVRDAVLDKYKAKMLEFKNIDESRNFLNSNLSEIQNYADSVILKNGFDYKCKVSLQNTIFPTKLYGDLSFPPGQYEALRIEIGKAEGENWWCVMFPPLCFVDITQVKTEEEAILSKKDYSLSKITKEEKAKVEKPIEEKTNDKILSKPMEEFTEDKNAVIGDETKSILKSSLNDEEFDIISKKDNGVKVKFKIVEFWQRAKNFSIE